MSTQQWFPQVGGTSIIEMQFRSEQAFVIEVAKVAASMVDPASVHAPEHFAELFDMVLKKTKEALEEK